MNNIISFLSKFPEISLIILAACSAITGDFFAKYWSLHTKDIFFLLALLFYLGSGFFYTPVLLREGLVISSILWSVLTTLGFIFIGIFFFHETITTIEGIGILIGIISLLILTVF